MAGDELEDAWLSTTEVQRRLGVPQTELYRRINDGDLVAYRIGRFIRIRPSDLEEFIKGGPGQ